MRISTSTQIWRTHLADIEGALLGTAAASFVFLLQWRYGFNWADEGWLWYISQRVSLGQVPVRDVFSYDPGRYYWSAAIFKLLGSNGFFEQLVANCLFGVIGLAFAYISMARVGMNRGWRLAILLLLAIVMGYPRHKVYEQTLSLISAAGIAFVVARPDKLKRWFLFGTATGFAAFIGRNSGFYFAVAAALAFVFLRTIGLRTDTFRTFGSFLSGIAIGYAPILFMLISIRGFAPAFVSSMLLIPKWSWGLPVPFPWVSHRPGLHGLDLIQLRAVSWLCIAVPACYAIIIWKSTRTRPSGAQVLALGASLAGIPYLHHAFYHADFPHISQGVVPCVVAAGAACSVLWTSGERRLSAACFAALSLVVLASWLPMQPLVQHLRTEVNASGTIATINIHGKNFEVPMEQAQIMRKVQAAFRNCGAVDGSFFEAPYYPGLYAFLGTRAPTWDVYFLWPRSKQTQEQEIAAIVQSRTSLLMINRDASFDQRDWLKISRTNPLLVRYLSSVYERVPDELPGNFELDVLPGSCNLVPK